MQESKRIHTVGTKTRDINLGRPLTVNETKTEHVFDKKGTGKVNVKSFLVDGRTSCCITASSPDVTLGAPILVLQQVRSGGAVTPDHVTDDEEEGNQAQTHKLQYCNE